MSVVEKKFNNGEIIVREGDVGSNFFKIIEGKAYVISNYEKKDQLQLAILEDGAYFGEMGILEEYPRSATIIAKGPTRVLEILKDDLTDYFTDRPEEIFVIMKLLAGRVQSMENDYNDAQNLLKTLRDSDSAKKQSLFSKIKKHVNHYQTNKDKVTPPSADALRDTLSTASDEAFGQIETYPKGTVIYNEGDDGDCMYILHVGKVCTYKDYGSANELKVNEYADNSFFGEMGMLSDDPRNATAVSEDDETYVEIIRQEDLEAIFRSCPEKVILIMRYLSYRLRKLNNDFLTICKEITESYDK